MKALKFLLAIFLLAITSCTNEKLVVESKFSSITASIENKETKSRLAVQQDNSLNWTVGDKICVFMADDSRYFYVNQSGDVFIPQDETQEIPNGTTNSDVVGVLYEGYDDEGSFPGGNVVGNSLESAFAQNIKLESSPENCIYLPMWGKWDNSHISFKHLAGILRVDLTDLPVGYDMVTIIASNPIAGTAVLEDINDPEPVLVINDGENYASIKFAAVTGNNDQNRTFYFPLPVGTYESIEVLVSKYDENLPDGTLGSPVSLAKWRNKTVKRATIYKAALAYKEVESIQDLNAALATISNANKNTHLYVSNQICGSGNVVEIPEVENSNLTLDFSSVENYASLNINSGSGSSAASTQNITVNVGNETTESAQLVINAPKATVELGAGHFSEITATTATNTLIINGGVTINRLTILGGNVLIEVGTQINQINNQGGGTITWIVKTEAGLVKAFEDGGKYVLYDDITVSDVNGINVGSGKKVVLDLNNKTIVAEGDGFVAESGETLMLNGNGFVKAGNTVGSWVAVWANGGTVIINDGKYSVGLDTDDSNSCVYVKNGGQVTINGGEFSHEIPTSGNNYGMPLQVNNDDTQGTITVNGGVFVLDNGRYYEDQDKNAGKIIINAGETVDNGKIIVSGATGNEVVIENKEFSDALYTLYGDQYYITINADGYAVMRESDVLGITYLNLDAYENEYHGTISSLNGIEKFVNLTHLNCRNSGLTECDFSQNTALSVVAIQNTTKLTSLDFSHNSQLQSLYFNYNSGLSSLNLEGCNNLSNIQLFGSALTSLDIPNKEIVTNLLFGGTLKLDPADYPNLTGLGCEKLELTDLDTFIPDAIKANLTYLSCENNKLTSLDLAKYPNLSDLSCSFNEIVTLDLSQTPNLQSLSCSYNKIAALDITACEGLNSLWCGGQYDIPLTLTLTSDQKAILIDNGYFDPTNQNVVLDVK